MLAGAGRLQMHLCLACFAAGEGRTWCSTVGHRLGLRSRAAPRLDLPPVSLRDTLLLLFGDEIQAGSAQDCGAGAAELPRSPQLSEKTSD